MLEKILPQPNPQHQELTNPEALSPVAQTLATIVITENGSGEDPRLSKDSRLPLLASGLLHQAGLAEKIAIISTPVGGKLAGEYLEGIDVPSKSLILREPKPDKGDSELLGRMARDNSLGDVVLVTTGKDSEDVLRELEKAGIDLSQISPEEEISRRIVDSMKGSRHALTELLKQALLSVGRWEKLKDVNFTRLQAARA